MYKIANMNASIALTSVSHPPLAKDPSEPLWEAILESLDWSLESLQAQLDIVVRDVDRFSAQHGDPTWFDWFDDLVDHLILIERQLSNHFVFVIPKDSEKWDQLAESLLIESDWLLERAEELLECPADVRLSIRLRALAAASFDTVRRIPVPVDFGKTGIDAGKLASENLVSAAA